MPAGGGGLLTVPALLAAGMSPARALATNKLRACGGSLSSSLYFIRRKVVNLADQKLNILMTFIGSTAGALLVQHVQSDILRQILPLLVICIGLYFLLMPKLGEEDRQRRLHGLPFALIAGGCVGFTMASLARGRLVLRAGIRDAGRVQPRQIHRPRQSPQRDLQRWRSAAVYHWRQGYLGNRVCDDGRAARAQARVWY